MTPARRPAVILWIAAVLLAGAAVSTVLALGGVLSRGPGEADPGSAARAPGETVVAFYGDSYTRGTGATATDSRWSTIVSAERGWTEVNPSRNGLGFVNQRRAGDDLVDQIIAARPDIVISTMGLNDNFSMPSRADEIEAAIISDFETIRVALPEARLIVVEPFWYTEERPDSVDQIIGWVQAAALAADADYIPGASHWLDGHPEWMADDGLHPNDAGYASLAGRMDAELAKLGL
ncbi:SGNH/GDSL hydrolase family protein [Cryobacterium sinapicolor]|uniref:SGNH/GDSL hydrolase family protein n=1 Tax=Cryobacterium sinapicolor TaxID=1259236 RepID=A0ABY2J1Z4_9MICO|nr:SGNH/GDSL hydrolase family protein [Cryobacterium sinapicolor]TFC98947.1 SGNH/GDSL hydrolase family protein [Cryobacterium sinapicolor]